FEVVQVLQATFGAVDQGAVVRIAFADIELAADHVVARAEVAADVDALDVRVRALFDGQHEIDEAPLVVAFAAGADGGKRIAATGNVDRHVLDGLVDGVGVVDAARLHAQLRS